MHPIRLVRFPPVVVGIISQDSHSQISRINRLSTFPNYREVGKALRELAFSVLVDDSPGLPEHGIPASELEQVACNLPGPQRRCRERFPSSAETLPPSWSDDTRLKTKKNISALTWMNLKNCFDPEIGITANGLGRPGGWVCWTEFGP